MIAPPSMSEVAFIILTFSTVNIPPSFRNTAPF